MAFFLRRPPKTDPSAPLTVELLGQIVPYRLHTGGRTRRTIGLRIDAQGLMVTLPRHLRRTDLAPLLQSKARWIVDKLQLQSQRHAEQAGVQQLWLARGELPFLGTTLSVREEPGLRRARYEINATADTHADAVGGTLTLKTGPADTLPARCRVWLREQALQYFTQRLQLWQGRMGGQITRVALSNARTRWGSANTQGHVRLNWRLIHFSPDVIDYVVCHELAHLQEMNHSPRFWAIVARHCPDYRRHESSLRTAVLPDLG